jgi:hypothetical protein
MSCRWRCVLAVATVVALAVAISAQAAWGVVTREAEGTFNGAGELNEPVVTAAVDNSEEGLGDVYTGLASGVVLAFNEIGGATGLSITGAKTPAKSFSLVKGSFTSSIAVDAASDESEGDIYVADIGHGVIDKFNQKGRYQCQITGSQTPSPSECDGEEGSKTPAGSLEPRGLAVDSSGDVYVSDVAHDVIDEFSATGAYLGQLSDPQPDPGPLAVDSNGDVYVVNGTEGTPLGIVELDPEGNVVPRPQLEAAPAVSVAIDPTSGDVIVSEPPFGISEYSTSEARLARFGQGGAALTASKWSGKLYANASMGQTVTIYSRLKAIPEVSTGEVTGLAAESATLNGEVIPEAGNEVRQCVFEYGKAAASEGAVECQPSATPPYDEATAVSDTVKLAPETTYHVRIRAVDALEGETHSVEKTFTTPAKIAKAPIISAVAANPSVAEATVRAQISPNGRATSCEVQYVEEAQFQATGYNGASHAPCSGPSLGEGFSAQQALAQIGGLRASTTYHYRFLATNALGTDVSEEGTFATFGIQSFSAATLNREGQPYTQAGGHPYKLVTSFQFNVGSDLNGNHATDANARDIDVSLPPGYIGNVNAVPRCTDAELVRDVCSPYAQVGVIYLRLDKEHEPEPEPLYNLVPPAGYPAALGFRIKTFVSVYILFKVRTGGDYGIDSESLDSSTSAGLQGATIEVWGVPGDPSHDDQRECGPPGRFKKTLGAEPCSINAPLVPFLTNPTSCTGPQTETIHADSWQAPGDFVTAATTLPGMTGCSSVPFAPKATVQPTTSIADTPTGLDTTIEVPQEETPEGVAQSELDQTVVALPPGLTASPSGAQGLEACSPEQIALHDASEPTCPGGSRIGSVEILTPLLRDPVDGSLYLAQQNANPFGSTLAIYLYAQADGAVIKLAGHVSTDPATGQLTTSFSETPQLPFKSLNVRLDPGPRASLATPEGCGSFSTLTTLAPWSGMPASVLSSPFEIVSGCGGSFTPSFSAGTANGQAGAFAPLVLSFSREDGEQELSGLTANLPVGLVAKLAGVPLCPDAAAAAGTCPEATRVGSVQAFAGPGPDPLPLHGVAYLTGPYHGAPYGLAVVVPAIAGPFDLGTVVVRQALYVNEDDAHVTAVSDPFPTILDVTGANGETDGFPVRLRRVDVSIDRPNFTLNPTDCNPLTIAASFLSKEGASVSETAPFQVANCANLKFGPRLAASIAGHASKADGVALTTKLTFPVSSLGTEANIGKVKVALPLQIPSEQRTLSKACLASVFERERSNCPTASLVGHAVAHTPLLSEPLAGPAYLVSHGNEAFPSLITVLKGDGITFNLVASTLIRKGITTSTFNAVPDVPVSSFELTFPAGPFSLLGANLPEAARYNFCGRPKMYMPTTFVGQNGVEFSSETPIAVTGCSATKAKHVKRKKHSARAAACRRHGSRSRKAACALAPRRRSRRSR